MIKYNITYTTSDDIITTEVIADHPSFIGESYSLVRGGAVVFSIPMASIIKVDVNPAPRKTK